MYLYDVNLLFAMLTPDHEFHRAARRWRIEASGKDWATCEITVSGFVRLSCNPALGFDSRLPSEAWDVLQANRRSPHHSFLTLIPKSDGLLEEILGHCRGHRQVTDALLLAIAMENGARLATFDSRIRHLSPDSDAVVQVPVI
jgi:toxin-antitoxin system PIN domain toxin